MSLINKMLQDLDARGGDGSRSAASSVVRPVGTARSGSLPVAAIGAGVIGLLVLGGAGFAAYKYFQRGGQPLPASVPTVAAAVVQAPAPQNVAPVAAPVAVNEPAAPAPAADAGQVRTAPSTGRERPEEVRRLTGRVSDPESLARAKSRLAESGAREQQPVAKPVTAVAGNSADASLSSQQKAENEYRRALTSLQDARVNEAIAGLEQAVYLYPRHDAARQTLVSLLIEGGRPAEAIRHLTFATSLDPRQSNMAMLLARLQLEHGGNALGTLQRCLPHAESNPDYRALLAGVLERHGRHKDAAEHYQAAVRLQPGNAVWWMGMGISLQGDKRNAEAKIAFQRARDTGRLAPELQTFVERRLQQLN